jgi:hypothetical protein
MRQFQNQLRATLAALQLEVEIAAREVLTTHREIHARLKSLYAAGKELEFISERWRHLAGDDRTASLVLEDMFAAQERLAAQEFEYLTAVVEYNVALVELQRAIGTLLQVEGIHARKTEDCGIPALDLQMTSSAVPMPLPAPVPMPEQLPAAGEIETTRQIYVDP